MELLSGKGVPKEVETILKDKVELECFMCMGEFDDGDYAPMMMCMNQHSCCAPCLQQLLKNDATKQVSCPHCNAPVIRKAVTKNRLLLSLYDVVKEYKKRVIKLQEENESLKKSNPNELKTSLLAKNPKMVSSFILSVDNPVKGLGGSMMLDDISTSKSQTLYGTVEKRRQILLAYAEREKIEQLKRIAKSQVPFDQITQIRSGYGSIRKIECMEYFTNLRELMLYNNHIKTIQGLNNNIKLNVLSLAYNKIQKIQNIGQLKELKRFSIGNNVSEIECNKITRSSAEYMVLYDWKTLESLTISFHEENKEANDECFALMFGTHSLVHWQGLKNLYIYNSKHTGERSRNILKEFTTRRKTPLQVYWS